MKHKGSCHCGTVAFEVEGDISGAMSCNCSMCQRKGSLLWFVPLDRLDVLTPEANASTYMFNKHVNIASALHAEYIHTAKEQIQRAIAWLPSTYAAWRASTYRR